MNMAEESLYIPEVWLDRAESIQHGLKGEEESGQWGVIYILGYYRHWEQLLSDAKVKGINPW